MMVPELTDILAIIFFLLLIILWKVLKKESKKNKSTFNKNIDYIIKEYDITPEENNNDNITIYEQKPLMSNYEFKFYKILEELKEEYEIMPQINLASIIKKINNNKYYSELFRNIDFAIFSKDYKELLLLIEINDKTHNELSRKDRDLKIQKICNDTGIKLMKFYTCYPNEKEYVINRIKKELNKENNIENESNSNEIVNKKNNSGGFDYQSWTDSL